MGREIKGGKEKEKECEDRRGKAFWIQFGHDSICNTTALLSLQTLWLTVTHWGFSLCTSATMSDETLKRLSSLPILMYENSGDNSGTLALVNLNV